PSSSTPDSPMIEAPRRSIADAESPKAASMPARHSTGPPHAESVAASPIRLHTYEAEN
ncbi:hypothetical protein E4U60_005410, partial [Claviceps pazoutovae]